MKVREILSKIMKKYRKENGLSQEKFAELSGLSVDTISLIECEKISPRFETVYKILTAMGVDLEQLLLDEIEKKK